MGGLGGKRGRVRALVCVCTSAWPLCALFVPGCAICQQRQEEDGEGEARLEMLPYVLARGACMCACVRGRITYVGVKRRDIFTSCRSSLLIDA